VLNHFRSYFFVFPETKPLGVARYSSLGLLNITNVLVCRLQIDQDIGIGGARGAAVLMPAIFDCHSDLVVFSVLDCGGDILVV